MKDKLLKSVKVKAPWSIVYFVDPLAVPGALVLSKLKWLHPNIITLSGLFFMSASALSFFRGDFTMGAGFYYLLLLVDTMDGKVARMREMTSDFGAKLDSMADKVNKIFPIMGILYGFYYKNNMFLLGLLLILGLHYGLHGLYHYILKIKKPASNRVIYDLKESDRPGLFGFSRIEGFFMPLDEAFFIMVVGPLTGLITEMIIAASVIYMLSAPVEYYGKKNEN